MSKIIQIAIMIIFVFPILTHCSSLNQTNKCDRGNGDYAECLSLFWAVLSLRDQDRTAFVIICPVLLFFQIVVLIMFGKNPSLFQKPGNIFFALVIIEMCLNLHLLSSSIYRFINHDDKVMPEHYVQACQATGFLQTLFVVNHISYLFIFLFYVVFLIRYSLKKKTENFWRLLHFTAFIFCLCITTFFFFDDFIGLNLYGYCGISSLYKNIVKSKWDVLIPASQIIMTVIFVGFGIFTYVYYRKHMPEGQLKLRKNQYSKIILLFVTGFSICQIVLSIMNLVLNLKYQSQKSTIGLGTAITIGNIIRVVQFYFTIFLIVWNDRFRRKLKFMLKSIFIMRFKKRDSETSGSSMNKTFQMQQIVINQKLLQIKDKSNQIDLLFVSQIYTIISGIYVVFFQYFKPKYKNNNYNNNNTNNNNQRSQSQLSSQSRQQSPSHFREHSHSDQKQLQLNIMKQIARSTSRKSVVPKQQNNKTQINTQNKLQSRNNSGFQTKLLNYKQNITIQIDEQTIRGYEFETRIVLKLQILKCRLSFYYPKIFQSLLEADGLENIHQSFKIMENIHKMWNLADGQGGKSGQFFFFSADRRFVLKTITIEQFAFLKKNISKFYQHYKANPKSLLAKIYGLFTISGDQIQRTYRLILMKNITGCLKQQISRVYDLKGSKYNREVIKSQIQPNQLQEITLKDVDFMKYQGKIKISQQSSKQLRKVLQKDAQFLRNLQLIDYSFLVVKVKWQKQPRDPLFWNNLQRIKHIQSKIQFYHLGIIDYLQLWDFQKKSESWWKKIIGKTDISAVDPLTYSTRFLNFVNEITMGELQSKDGSEIDQMYEMREKQQEQRHRKEQQKLKSNERQRLGMMIQKQNIIKFQRYLPDSSLDDSRITDDNNL